MIKSFRQTYSDRLSLAIVIAAAVGGTVASEGLSLNYDALSSLEQPLAIEIGDTTIQLRGLLDFPVTAVTNNGDDWTTSDIEFAGNIEVSASTQLSNRWTVGVAYFGQYDSEDPLDSIAFQRPKDDSYSDNAAAFVSGSWGTVAAGNVSGLVREETRRQRGVGNARLAFAGLRGSLSDSGAGYVGRFGPTRISTVVDEDGDFEVGGSFQRPLGKKDYRFSGRYSEGTTLLLDGLSSATSRGGEAVAEVTYGSTQLDIAAGVENIEIATDKADRWYTSVGARHKVGGLSLSVEGHYGEVDGQAEKAASIGGAFDIARGLSLNLGVNYEDAQIDLGNAALIDTGETEAVVSLRYSF